MITRDRDIAASLPRQVAVRDGRIEADSTHDAPLLNRWWMAWVAGATAPG